MWYCGWYRETNHYHRNGGIIMTKNKRYGLAISAAAACIAVLCVAGACNGSAKEEKAVHRVIVTTATTTATSQPTESSTTTAPLTTTAPETTTAETTTEPQITTTVTCATTETTTTTEQTTTADTTVPPTTTTAPVTTTASAPAEPHNGQTSGDYIYCIGFGWIFNEGGGGEGSVNYEMYCNGNKIGYFG